MRPEPDPRPSGGIRSADSGRPSGSSTMHVEGHEHNRALGYAVPSGGSTNDPPPS